MDGAARAVSAVPAPPGTTDAAQSVPTALPAVAYVGGEPVVMGRAVQRIPDATLSRAHATVRAVEVGGDGSGEAASLPALGLQLAPLSPSAVLAYCNAPGCGRPRHLHSWVKLRPLKPAAATAVAAFGAAPPVVCLPIGARFRLMPDRYEFVVVEGAVTPDDDYDAVIAAAEAAAALRSPLTASSARRRPAASVHHQSPAVLPPPPRGAPTVSAYFGGGGASQSVPHSQAAAAAPAAVSAQSAAAASAVQPPPQSLQLPPALASLHSDPQPQLQQHSDPRDAGVEDEPGLSSLPPPALQRTPGAAADSCRPFEESLSDFTTRRRAIISAAKLSLVSGSGGGSLRGLGAGAPGDGMVAPPAAAALSAGDGRGGGGVSFSLGDGLGVADGNGQQRGGDAAPTPPSASPLRTRTAMS